MAQASEQGLTLGEHQWQKRLLLIFAPSEKSPSYEEQQELLDGGEASFADRDVLVGRLLDKGRSRLGDRALTAEEVVELRRRFNLEEGCFRILLVGLDGTEKWRDDTPVKPEAILRHVDEMSS